MQWAIRHKNPSPWTEKKEKAENKHTKHWNILQKIIVKKYLRLHLQKL